MMQQTRCHNCNIPLGYCFEEKFSDMPDGTKYPVWNDRLLSFNLKITRHAECCDKCKHVRNWEYFLSFCSTECLHSAFNSGKVQKYIDRHVFFPITELDPFIQDEKERGHMDA